jgi:CheY-like chemotaxis protein
VDDEKDFVSTFAQRLRLRGIHAEKALSGEVALRIIAADAPQVVGLDIMMPGMNGLDVLKRIKADYCISRSYFWRVWERRRRTWSWEPWTA